ncbi:Vacuolar amino acid transporter 3 [Diplonema papillatum]|nr:Vacuolar amino acid transporter 3 [Diplonema papillatum]
MSADERAPVTPSIPVLLSPCQASHASSQQPVEQPVGAPSHHFPSISPPPTPPTSPRPIVPQVWTSGERTPPHEATPSHPHRESRLATPSQQPIEQQVRPSNREHMPPGATSSRQSPPASPSPDGRSPPTTPDEAKSHPHRESRFFSAPSQQPIEQQVCTSNREHMPHGQSPPTSPSPDGRSPSTTPDEAESHPYRESRFSAPSQQPIEQQVCASNREHMPHGQTPPTSPSPDGRSPPTAPHEAKPSHPHRGSRFSAPSQQPVEQHLCTPNREHTDQLPSTLPPPESRNPQAESSSVPLRGFFCSAPSHQPIEPEVGAPNHGRREEPGARGGPCLAGENHPLLPLLKSVESSRGSAQATGCRASSGAAASFSGDEGSFALDSFRRSLNLWEDHLTLVDAAAGPRRGSVQGEFVDAGDYRGRWAEDAKDQRLRGVSDLRAFLLILKSYVGTSILLLPRAFADGGVATSAAAFAAVGLLSVPCLVLLSKAATHVGVSRYSHIALAAFGKGPAVAVDVLICLAQLSVLVMNFAFLFRSLQRALEYATGCSAFVASYDMLLVGIAAPVVITPITLVRKVQTLAAPLFFADATILAGIIVLTVQALVHISGNGTGPGVEPAHWSELLVSVGTEVFTFEGAVCTILPVRAAMRRPDHFPWVLAAAITARMLVYLGFAAAQYLAFGAAIFPTAILNLPANLPSMFLVVPYIFAIAFLFPQTFQPTTMVLEDFVGWKRGAGKRDVKVKIRKNVFRFVLLLMIEGVAFAVNESLDAFTSVCGALFLVPLVFVLPPLLVAALRGPAESLWSPKHLSLFALAAAALVSAVGIAVQSVLLAFGTRENQWTDYCDR